MNIEQKYTAAIMGAVEQIFDPESDRYMVDMAEMNGTAFFTAYIMAFSMHYNRFTSSNGDLFDGINLANRLVFQYLMENGKEKL